MAHVVSVLMPVYNGQRYLALAVRSILDQRFGDFELIIVNDGSTDDSLSILRDFADRDSRIRLISRPNTGYVAALNEALSIADGEFIARMDGDDISLPNRFADQVAYLREHPDCVLLGTHVITMDQDGDVIGPMPDIAFGHDAIDAALLTRGWPIVHPAVMMRADALRKVGGYRADYCPNEDHDLFLKLAEVGRVENLPTVLFHYRRHPGSVSSRSGDASHALLGRIVAEARARRGLPPIGPPQTAVSVPPVLQLYEMRNWAWLALKNKNISTARKYALVTLRQRPFALDSWRLAYCAARGR